MYDAEDEALLATLVRVNVPGWEKRRKSHPLLLRLRRNLSAILGSAAGLKAAKRAWILRRETGKV